MDKALQCIHLARAINDRYDDPSKMPGEEVANRKSLLAEAMRLQEIADTERSQSKLEAWASAPDADQPAVAAMASKAMTDAKLANGADQFAAANTELMTQRFAKAPRGGAKSPSLEDTAARIDQPAASCLRPCCLPCTLTVHCPP